jgi:hypothetical protein
METRDNRPTSETAMARVIVALLALLVLGVSSAAAEDFYAGK